MNGFYEFAKYVDVLVIFLLFMGVGMYGIISIVGDCLYLLIESIKKLFKEQEKELIERTKE